jgi:ubiquinol-cytochrome c reductase cytochrome c1 subunit
MIGHFIQPMKSSIIFSKKLVRSFTSNSKSSKFSNLTLPLSLLSGSLVLGSGIYYNYSFTASEDAAHTPHYPFNHKGMDESFDSKSIRRGYQVFKNVCSSCHGMNRMAMRQLVDVAYTTQEAKKLAAQMEVEDKQPNEQGKPVIRPGTLADYFPSPFKNEQEARFVNGGALPPDLSLVVKARDEAEDYIFSLLTGFTSFLTSLKVTVNHLQV